MAAKGTESNPSPDAAEPKKRKERPDRPVVCWETGELFPSAQDAARAVGAKAKDRITTAIARRATAGGLHWYWADEPKPDASELTKPSTTLKRPVVCYETGEVFENYVAAAQAVGLKSAFSIISAIKNKSRAGGYHWYYQGTPKPDASELKTTASRPVVCWETGQVFESSYAAIAAVGLKNPFSIGKAIKRKGTAGGYHWYYQDTPRPNASELLPSKQAIPQVLDSTAKEPRAVVCWETGDTYASAAEAAAAVGLSASVHIYRAIKSRDKAGGYHWHYQDKPRPSADELKRPVQRTRASALVCWETGEVFESAAAAAKTMGLKTVESLYTAIRKGTASAGLHWYWHGDPKPDPSQLKNLKAALFNNVECVETGVVYENTAAAAKAVGAKSQSSIASAVRTGRTAAGYHWRHQAPKKKQLSVQAEPDVRSRKKGARPIVCLETGQVFPSVKEAALAMSVTYGGGNLSQAALHGGMFKGYHWYFEGDPKPQPGDLKGNKAVTCLDTGETFESAAAAAEWANTTVDAVYASVRLHKTAGGYQFRLKGSEDKGNSKKPARGVVCWETGEVFANAGAAAAAVGLKGATPINAAIRSGGMSGGFHWYWQGDPKPSAEQLKKPVGSSSKPVVCWETGEVFPTAKAAAESVGLKSGTSITTAVKKGYAAGGCHWYWEGQPKPSADQLKGLDKDKELARAVACWETGEVYPSIKAAAEAMGLKGPGSISTAIKKRTSSAGYHWYWADGPKPGASELVFAQDRPTRAVACWETGEVFPSAKDAARAVGVSSKSNICFAIKNRSTAGGFHWHWADEPKPNAEQLGHGRKRPVICWETGVEYESVAAAAKAVGASGIGAALRSGSMAGGYHWYYKGAPKPDASTFKSNRPVVCYETNRVFSNTQEAADWAGTTVSGIYTALRTKSTSGGYHWYLQGNPRPEEFPPASGGRKARPVVCYETGQVFPSCKKAAEFAGVSGTSAIRWAMGKNKNGQRRSVGGYHWYYADEPMPEALAVEQNPEQLKQEKPELKHQKPKKGEAAEERSKTISPKQEKKSGKPGRRPKPVVCAETGAVYGSAKEAAAAVDVTAKSISVAACNGSKSGGFHWFYEGEDGPKEKQRKPRAVVCWETDEVFPSEEAAAEWAGTTVEAIDTVIRTRRSAGGYHWYLEGKPKPDASKLVERRRVVCLETGEVFASINAAADAVGVTQNAIYLVLRHRNHAAGGFHWYWEGDPKPDPDKFKPRKNHPIMCVETGVVYESVTAAARAVGTKNNSSISRAARKGYTTAGYHWRYVEEN